MEFELYFCKIEPEPPPSLLQPSSLPSSVPSIEPSQKSSAQPSTQPRNLLWLDNSQMSGEERARRNKADGFWSVESYLEKLKKNFQKYYEPKRYLSIDEMCIHFKGRMRCKCYNPNKPNKGTPGCVQKDLHESFRNQ